MPPRKYRPLFFFSLLRAFFPYEPRSFSLSLPYLLYLFNVRNREIFPPWIRYTFSMCFVCRRLSFSSRRCLLFHPFITFGLRPPPYTKRLLSSLLLFFFGLNHYYQSSLYRLNSNPPPTITLLYHAVVFSLPSCVKRQFRSSPQFITHPLTACRAILTLFLHWFAIYPSRVLERTSAFQYFDFHLALCVANSALASHLAIFALLIGLHS